MPGGSREGRGVQLQSVLTKFKVSGYFCIYYKMVTQKVDMGPFISFLKNNIRYSAIWGTGEYKR